MSKQLAISLIIISLITGVGVGYIFTPEYKAMNANESTSHSTNLGKADKFVDLRFIEAMIKHHEGALNIAQQAKDKTKRGIVRDFAQKVIDDQSMENEKLYKWRKEWYEEDSKINMEEKVNLGDFDDKFDLRFLNSMIAHHEEAVELSKQIQAKSSRNDILNLADEIISKQSDEVEFMKKIRGDLYEVYRQEHI